MFDFLNKIDNLSLTYLLLILMVFLLFAWDKFLEKRFNKHQKR